MNITKNDIIPLEISSMTSEGSGIGKIDTLAVFVPRTAVGDKINCRIIKLAKNYAVGRIEKIITPSPSRIESDCPYFQQCGGCVYRHISYADEVKIKYDRVKDCIERIGGFKALEIKPVIAAKNRCHYRNKAQIPLGLDRNGGLIMGFYANHSHRIIDADACLLQPDEFKTITEIFRRWFRDFGDSVYNESTNTGNLRHLYIRRGEKSGEIMVCVVINGNTLKNADKLASMLEAGIPEVTSLVLNTNTRKTNVILGEKCRTVFGSDTISDILCGLKFHLSPLSFYQVNHVQAQKLYEKAAEYAQLTGNESLLDLYCGTGTIGLSMAREAKKLIGVEIIPSAIENAKRNAEENKIANAEFICGDAAKAAELLAERGEKPDVIIIDPPRKGCAADLIDTISDMSPKRVVYVSCDPATLARDLKLFAEKNFEIKELTPCDLFPGTAHVECVVLMAKVQN